jgi:putative transposase
MGRLTHRCHIVETGNEGHLGRLTMIEVFFSRDWLSTTTEEFVAAWGACIRWYNDAQIKISVGFRRPVENRRRMGILA